MANQEHVDILKQGVEVWNHWISLNFGIMPDLRGLELQEVDLNGANLSEANLSETDLSYANLFKADLSRADLREANLLEANLHAANLLGTNLSDARLSRANLLGTNLTSANLSHADLAYTILIETDLSKTIGLDTIKHRGYSFLHSSTISLSEGKLPTQFLRVCGLSDWEIEAAKLYNSDLTDYQIAEINNKIFELRSGPAIHYSSCFISYSKFNQDFADKIHERLQDTGIRCWFDKKDLRTGNILRKTITDSIRVHDKLLLILSKESIKAKWVKFEVDKALDREIREDREILFPILMEDIPITYENWMETILHERHYLDFRKWDNRYYWNKSFEKLLNDLKN